MKHLLFTLLIVISLSAFAQTEETVKFNGKNRSMIVYKPKDLPDNAPLVITLHGFNQSAQYQMEHTKWNTVAEAEKFVVVYPNYDGGWWDVNGTNDTSFIEYIMKLMHERNNIDLNRVYVSGFSLGAMMTYHCIEVLANKVAAFAPVSGVRFDNKAPESPRIVPIIHTHCKGDDVFKWEGDPGHASGGYPYIPDYVKSWAEYFGMNPEPEFIDPYPANKPNSDVDLTIYRRDDSVAEVRLLSFDGAGHWHVDADGWGGVSTTWEIWNFCKRYTLNLDEVAPPRLVSISPEDKSFDLTQGHREFSLLFDRGTWVTGLSAKLVSPTTTINLELKLDDEEGPAGLKFKDVKFVVPEETAIPDGTYTLTIDGIRQSEDFTSSYSFEYTYGYEETGDQLNVETIFEQDWDSMYKENLSRIPDGWQRVSTKTDGTTETISSADDAGTGSRLAHIWEYGDISTGMYFSARDLQSCNINYGKVKDNLINLPVGKYVLSFNSAYWDKGSQRGKAVFDVTVISKSNRGGYKTVVKETDLKPEGCVNAGNGGPIFDAKYHEYDFSVSKKDNYVINFDSHTKAAVCLGNVKITTAPSNADRYKGDFLRLYKLAENIYYNELTDEEREKAIDLKSALDKYKDFASTSPSEYTAAYDELYAATSPWMPLPVAIEQVSSEKPAMTEFFSLDGKPTTAEQNGIVIVRKQLGNGKTEVKKILK